MPIDPLYSDSPLLQGSKTDGCPKTSTDVSYTSVRGYPVVTDISDRKICTSELFKTGEGDQYLYNTSGCCVLDSSATNCHDIANVDAEEENNYYMGLRYFDVSDETSGERKICYTTPIRKKKVNIMDLLTKVLMDIIIFIIMVLVAACYEYWIIYGGCSRDGIKTTLYESPYNVGNNSTKPSAPKPNNSKKENCPGNTVNSSSGSGLEWYDTFPYNLITLLNNNKANNGKDTSKSFALSELAKIPARSLLLGFFYCIIFSRMYMLGLIGWVNEIGSYIYNKDPSKLAQFMSGLIFIFVFMGIYGALTDRYIIKLPYLNASSLFLLVIIIVFTIWIPSLFSFFIMMLTFVGYRRGSYEKCKRERQGSIEETTTEMNVESFTETIYKPWDWHWIIDSFIFNLKRNLVTKENDHDVNKLYTIDTNNNFNINNEDDLDWFFPIRRSKMEWSCWSHDIANKFKNLFNIDFTTCSKDGNPKHEIDRYSKYYWYLSEFWYKPWHLFNPMFTLQVDCAEIEKANNKSKSAPLKIIFMIVLSFFFPQIRFYMFLISIAFLIAVMVLILLSSILWTCLVITIVIYSIFIALLGNILALFYLHFYVIIGFFYVPFKDYPQLFKIVKSHGNILTLLFCIIVVLAGVKVLHPTSVGVIGGILGLLVLYKIITLLSV
jgi:hypothetical protein